MRYRTVVLWLIFSAVVGIVGGIATGMYVANLPDPPECRVDPC